MLKKDTSSSESVWIPVQPVDFIPRKKSDTTNYVFLGIYCGMCVVVFLCSIIALLQKTPQINLKPDS